MASLFLSRLNGLHHTNAEIPFDWKALWTRGIIVLQRNLYGNCYNENWVHPMSEDIPPNLIRIEGGSFL